RQLQGPAGGVIRRRLERVDHDHEERENDDEGRDDDDAENDPIAGRSPPPVPMPPASREQDTRGAHRSRSFLSARFCAHTNTIETSMMTTVSAVAIVAPYPTCWLWKNWLYE